MKVPKINVQEINVKEGVKNTVKKKKFKLGTYTAATSAIVIAIAVLVYMCVGAIPDKFSQFDLSDNQLYSITDETEQIVGNLEEDINIYWIVQDGQEDDTLEKMIDKYENLSKHIIVTKVDPAVNPNFAYQFTSSNYYNNSLAVTDSSGEKSSFIGYYDIYEYSYDSSYNETTSFAGESALTSAIYRIINEETTSVLYTEGHGELDMPDDFIESFQNKGAELEGITLLNVDSIPVDTECLIIYSPEKDFSVEDCDKAREYLSKGGNIMLFTDVSEAELDNLMSLMSEYGVSLVDGLVIEGNSNYCYSQYTNYLIPDIESHDITSSVIEKNYTILYPMAQGIEIDSETADESLTVDALLRSSSSAYSKLSGINTTESAYAEGDITTDEGFPLAVAVTKSQVQGDCHITWFTNTYFLEYQIDTMTSGANMDLAVNAFTWMSGSEDYVNISARTVEYEYLTLTASQSRLLTALVVFMIPIFVIVMGIVTVIKRKHM